MSSGTHVLCVDTDPDMRSVTATALEQAGTDFTVTTAGCSRDALTRVVDSDDIDCVVSEYDMPGLNGLELLEGVRDHDSELPVILFTGTGSETIASEAISAGVTDYLQKASGTDQYTVLANRITNAVERRRTVRTRRESERELEQYRTLVETVSDPMFVLDEMGRCIVVNQALCDLFDVDRDRIVGTHITAFISRTSFERGVKTVRRLYKNDRESDRFEFTVETDAGERRTAEANVTALTDDHGEFAGSTAVIRDITARKRRERELTQYERIIELAPIALFLLDENANIIWLNDQFAAVFEEDASELLELSFPDLIERGYYDESVTTSYVDEVRKLLSSSFDHERAKYRVQFQTSNGDERVHDVHTKLLPLEDGEFTGTIHAIRDITKRRRYQRELERQNERLAEFASVVSHDLRNPLNVAQGSLELHADECPLETESDSLAQVRWSLKRMDDLIEDLLSLARHGRTVGEPGPVDLDRLVHSAWDTVDTADATLECSVDATIAADEGRVQALLENLFRNSVEHGSTSPASQAQQDSVEHSSTSSRPRTTRNGTDVTVTVGLLEDGGTDGRSETGFYVADDGPGLADTEEIFTFGHTTADGGTGLGLAIVEQIAEAHEWTVTAQNDDCGGARFEIRDVTLLEEE